jgi:hypothetical protein
MQLTRMALCDIIHGVARSQHHLIIITIIELSGSHTTFPVLRLLRVDSIVCRIFMLPLRSLAKYFINLGLL